MNEAAGVWGVTLDELEDAIRAVEPRALLVPSRILRRVIKQDRHVPGPGLRVPHRKSLVIDRDELLAIVGRSELGIAPDAPLPERLILLARPEAETLASIVRSRALTKYWRLLFHARVHLACDERIAAGGLTPLELRDRIERIGPTAFQEIRAVLRAEDLLLPPVDDCSVYIEFAAVYLELRSFVPALVADYFPSLDDLAGVDALLREDFDADTLLNETRLPGIGHTEEDEAPEHESWADYRLPPGLLHPRKQSERRYCRLMERADRARFYGNLVRSARLRGKAALVIGPKQARSARAEGRDDIRSLAERLQTALGLDPEVCTEWPETLSALLPPAVGGLWTAEGRLLYDLQKVCIDHERGVFKLDVATWLRSFFRAPLKRPVPCEREVLMIKHLHRAQQRLKGVRVPPTVRQQLADLLEAAIAATERRLDLSIRPRLVTALDEVGLRPRNVPEEVAHRKLVSELVDQITDRGYLTMGDLRDTVSRNNLKLEDLSNVGSVLSDDQLLATDRILDDSLAGVYRRGELYLRLPQAFSSVAFGTPRGRFLTRYAILPFGGSFVILEALQHLIEKSAEHFGTAYFTLRTTGTVVLLGLFIMGILYYAPFRSACLAGIRGLWWALRGLLYDLPKAFLHLPWVRTILETRPLQLFARYALKPLVFTALILGTMSTIGHQRPSLIADWSIFLAMNVLLNSRIGRDVDEFVTDWFVRTWHHLRMRVFAGIFRWITDTSRQALEALERLLYSVDEWLRFRSGEQRSTVVAKSVLGIVWAAFSYLIRFCVNLLIEPQINPIKHFPVVTVSHKVLLSAAGVFVPAMETVLAPVFGKGTAYVIAWSTLFLVPGVFGFLVWELKENWRLYGANRSPKLQPVVVSLRHGETIVRLVRPGLHSGTLPKTLAKLRRADRKAVATGKWNAVRKHRDHLAHVALDVRRFVDREFCTLIELSDRWPSGEPSVGQVRLGLNNIRIELLAPDLPGGSLWLAFDECAGSLMAGIDQPGWLSHLTGDPLDAVSQALAGLYKMSGVDLVREQVEAQLGPTTGFEFRERGLVIWPNDDPTKRAMYDLSAPRELVPQAEDGQPIAFGPVLDRQKLVFGTSEITWTRWLEIWSLGQPAVPEPQALATVALISPPHADSAEARTVDEDRGQCPNLTASQASGNPRPL